MPNANEVCLYSLVALDDITTTNPETTSTNNYGVFQAVKESSVRGGVVDKIIKNPLGKEIPQSGSTREMVVKYFAQDCTAAVDCTDTTVCDDQSRATASPLLSLMEIEQCAEYSWSQSLNDFTDNCESYTRLLATKFDSAKRGILAKIDAYWATVIDANVGNYYANSAGEVVDSATDPRSIYLFSDFTGGSGPLATNANAFIKANEEADLMGAATFTAVGDNALNKWLAAGSTYFGNTEGRDISRQTFNGALYVDNKLRNHVGASSSESPIYTWVDGYIQPLFFNYYETPELEVNTDVITKTTIDLAPEYAIGQIMGLPVDLEIRVDSCAEPYPVVNYLIRARYDLWTIPDNAFNTACGQYHNGLLKWLAACGSDDCDSWLGTITT